MSDLLPWITAASAIIAALLALYGAWNSRATRKAAEDASSGIIQVDGKVYDLGTAVDGRLSALLATTERLARAEGVAAGEQSQRDRAAEAQA